MMVMAVRASWVYLEAVLQKTGHQGARAPVPALKVPRCNHMHPECSSVSSDHIGNNSVESMKALENRDAEQGR